jgi:Subtilase family
MVSEMEENKNQVLIQHGHVSLCSYSTSPSCTGEFQGSMGLDKNSIPQRVNIPVAGMDAAAGLALLDRYRGQRMTLENPLETKNAAGEFVSGGGYGFLSGTSMAAPHVAGAAGLIWRACPSCTRDDVWRCLVSTAEDLGDEGRDDYFGEGLVQADLSFQCLLESNCCDDEAVTADPVVAAASSTHSAADSPLILV